MPVRVRPSWFVLSIDNTSNGPVPVKATGPKGRSGTGSVRVKVRENGGVLDLLDVDAIGSADGASVLVTVKDLRTGRVLFSERFAQ
jgi:hypothetical protein